MATLNYPDKPLHEVMRDTVRRHSDKTAIWFEGNAITFAQFDLASNRLANALRAIGLDSGDRLGLFLPNCPEYEVGFYAAMKLGAVVCPLNPSYRSAEITHILNDSGSSILLTHAKLLPFVQAVRGDLRSLHRIVVVGDNDAPRAERNVHRYCDLLASHSEDPPKTVVSVDQLGALPYSSGTTGMPKGVMLTHRNLVSNHLQFATASDLGPDDSYIVYLPLSHIYGAALMGMGMMTGLEQIILERFDLATLVRLIEERHVTWVHVVPPVLLALSTAPGLGKSQFRRVKFFFNAAAPLAPEVARRVEERLGVHVIQGYGLTEASPDTHHSPLTLERIKLESGGIPVADTEHRVVDLETGERVLDLGEVGEIIVRGPQVMRGYWNAPHETAHALRNGWLYTGDVGWIDREGYVFICDRKKEMIKCKGFSVSPAELEAVLLEHADVADCGVVGALDEEAGQVPKAVVVPRSGAILDVGELSEFVAARVAGYKQIRQWVIVDKIPRTPTGKILRRNLKNLPPNVASPS